MRKLLALVVLLCGAASADAANTRMWCSEGAQLLLPSQGDDDWILKVDGKPDERLNGLHEIKAVDLILHDADAQQRQNDLIYSRGRIFRPCEKNAREQGSDREAELEAAIEKIRAETTKLEAAIEKIRAETSKPQTPPKLRRAIALILKDLKQ